MTYKCNIILMPKKLTIIPLISNAQSHFPNCLINDFGRDLFSKNPNMG